MASPIGSEFTEFVLDHLDDGRQHMAEAMKSLLYHADPVLFETLDFYDDASFLEPMLFSYFQAPDPTISLGQILFGAIAAEKRPLRTAVRSDHEGIIYLPNYGYFLTDHRDAYLDLEWDPQLQRASLSANGSEVAFRFEDILRVTGTLIEVYRYPHPLLNRFHVNEEGTAVTPCYVPLQHLKHLDNAFDAIRTLYPQYYDALLQTVRGIVVFSNQEVNSFATFAAHGVAFLNTESESRDEIFFIEDLLHQCGHVVCSTLTFRKQDYFVVDPDVSLGRLTGNPNENRSLYVTFHGVFTETAMNQCLYRCLGSGMYTGQQEHELLGRLAFIHLRNRLDLENISYPQVYAEPGLSLLRIFVQSFREVHENIRERVAGLDLSGQHYNFSYARFVALNPLLAEAIRTGIPAPAQPDSTALR